MATYYDRLKNNADIQLFRQAVDQIIDNQERFPTVKQLREAYWDERTKRGGYALRLETPEDAMYAAGKANAARLKREGLPSDRMLLERIEAGGMPTYHPPGSLFHEAALKTMDLGIRSMEARLRQLTDMMDETDDMMVSEDLTRRYDTVSGAYTELSQRRETFATTGEMPLMVTERSTSRMNPNPFQFAFTCNICFDTHYFRVNATPGSRHFAASIPCPHCMHEAYAAYCAERGTPAGMPV